MSSTSLPHPSGAHAAAPSSLTRRAPPISLGIALPLLLFAATVLSTTAVGVRYMYSFHRGQVPLLGGTDLSLRRMLTAHTMLSGLPFSATLIAILLTHEFAHYFACRRYHVRCSLPYLLPAPTLSGTFGAVIRLRSPIRSRAALVAVGASGPVAGFAAALAGCAIGMFYSTYAPLPAVSGVQVPLAFTALDHLLRLVRPAPGLMLIVPHPVLVASWIGMLITALNLIPAGQLDGGHIVYAISPAAHRWMGRVVLGLLLLLGTFSWAGWLLWAAILQIPAMRHPPVRDATPLTRSSVALIFLSAAILLLSATVAPFRGFSLLELWRS